MCAHASILKPFSFFGTHLDQMKRYQATSIELWANAKKKLKIHSPKELPGTLIGSN